MNDEQLQIFRNLQIFSILKISEFSKS